MQIIIAKYQYQLGLDKMLLIDFMTICFLDHFVAFLNYYVIHCTYVQNVNADKN